MHRPILPDRAHALPLRDQVYQTIKNDILNGRHGVGERLSVNELAQKYQVSKTPIRDALTALQQEGLVEVIPRVGYFTTHITVKDVEDIFELRLIVESASAELAAQRIKENEVHHLEKLSSRYVSGDLESYNRFLAENREFHTSIARATGNKRLAEVVDDLLGQMQRLLILRLDLRDNADEMIEEHHRIVEALKKGDGASARAVMRESIENARQAVLQAIMRCGEEWPL